MREKSLFNKDDNDLIDKEHFLGIFINDAYKFEILSEEDKEIDIQAITYFDEVRDLSTWSNETLSDNQRSILIKIKELTKAIKQLDKKLK